MKRPPGILYFDAWCSAARCVRYFRYDSRISVQTNMNSTAETVVTKVNASTTFGTR
ncbi:hypothetical protein D3C71_2052380 [compost metagenome]